MLSDHSGRVLFQARDCLGQPPKADDRDLTSPVKPADGSDDMAARIENRLPFGSGAERLCQTMPELGSIPFVRRKEKSRQVIRLVSANAASDLSIELQAGINKIGRQRNGNHIVLMSGEISRFHAELQVSDEGIMVRDLGSANGTFVNGARVTEARIDAGDLLGFSSQFLFKLLIDMAMQALRCSPSIPAVMNHCRARLRRQPPAPARCPPLSRSAAGSWNKRQLPLLRLLPACAADAAQHSSSRGSPLASLFEPPAAARGRHP